jgi:hypothetical protein
MFIKSDISMVNQGLLLLLLSMIIYGTAISMNII